MLANSSILKPWFYVSIFKVFTGKVVEMVAENAFRKLA